LRMGADARATHTVFRRLMIHEAACNGSIQCLTLLLELGQRYGEDADGDVNSKMPAATRVGGRVREFELPFLPRRIEPNEGYGFYMPRFGSRSWAEKPRPEQSFLAGLRLFRELTAQVKQGQTTELDAARRVMEHANMNDLSKASIVRSCVFNSNSNGPTNNGAKAVSPRSYGRPVSGNSDGHGNTPLHWAAFKNETECVSLLLRYNADPNARAHPSGWTPLHDAAYSNSVECIDLLLDAGANVDARANSGASPLCFAAQEDAAEAAELLLRRGADLTTRCAGGPIRDDGSVQPGALPHSRFSGYTPLHYCAHYNAQRAARALLKHHTSALAMEMPDLSDRLPIHVAVARGSSDVLRELLHAGARVETRKYTPPSDSASRRRLYQSRRSPSSVMSSLSASASPSTPTRRQAPSPELTPRRRSTSRGRSDSATPVSSPILRSMIPSQPVASSKPWNCLSQRSIDECRELISQAEQNWAPDRHSLFTPADRQAVMELLRVGKRLELSGAGIFTDLWPLVLSFCGRGWFEVEEAGDDSASILSGQSTGDNDDDDNDDCGAEQLSLPTF
jgi:ankyrin repeat protein